MSRDPYISEVKQVLDEILSNPVDNVELKCLANISYELLRKYARAKDYIEKLEKANSDHRWADYARAQRYSGGTM